MSPRSASWGDRCAASTPSRWAELEAFSGYGPWLERLEAVGDVAPQHLHEVLQTHVRFVAQEAKMPAGLDASDIEGSYIDLCARGDVPTRIGDLHDLCNALVWARFPRAKQALHRRQRRLAEARSIPPGTQRVRTREQDSCAMLDEGGMLIGPSSRTVFGHAALLDAIAGRPLRPFLLHLPSDDLEAALAERLEDPEPLPRVRERFMLQLEGGAHPPAASNPQDRSGPKPSGHVFRGE